MAFASACLSVRHEGDALATPESTAATQRACPEELLRELGLCQCDPDCPLASGSPREALEQTLANACARYHEEFDRRRAELRQLRSRVQKCRVLRLDARPQQVEHFLADSPDDVVLPEEHENQAATEQQLASAEAAHARWLQEVRRETLAGLPGCVREQLQRAFANRRLPETYRGYELSTDQQSALQLTRMKYYERLALAGSDATRQALQREYASQIGSILHEEHVRAGEGCPLAADPRPDSRQVN